VGPLQFYFFKWRWTQTCLLQHKEDASCPWPSNWKKHPNIRIQVVVAGYGTQRRKRLHWSIVLIGSRDIARFSGDSVLSPFRKGSRKTRCTFSDGQPGSLALAKDKRYWQYLLPALNSLYAVDGFPTDNIQTINPMILRVWYTSKGCFCYCLFTVPVVQTVGHHYQKRSYWVTNKSGHGYGATRGNQKASLWMRRSRPIIIKQFYWEQESRPGEWCFRRPRYLEYENQSPQTVLDVISGKNINNVDALDAVLRTALQQLIIYPSHGKWRDKYAISGYHFDQTVLFSMAILSGIQYGQILMHS